MIENYVFITFLDILIEGHSMTQGNYQYMNEN